MAKHSENKSCDYHFMWNLMRPVLSKGKLYLCKQERLDFFSAASIFSVSFSLLNKVFEKIRISQLH